MLHTSRIACTLELLVFLAFMLPMPRRLGDEVYGAPFLGVFVTELKQYRLQLPGSTRGAEAGIGLRSTISINIVNQQGMP
jgi:hypothetical protein